MVDTSRYNDQVAGRDVDANPIVRRVLCRTMSAPTAASLAWDAPRTSKKPEPLLMKRISSSWCRCLRAPLSTVAGAGQRATRTPRRSP